MSVLYVMATPIGNLEDISERARRILSECDLIAAEDTRVTQKLLNRLGLRKPALSCHRHNEGDRAGDIIRRMREEDISVVLVSDAGTPCISDPGSVLVDAAWEAGIRVVPVPGASAASAAVSACGFNAAEFAFYGFLPREKKDIVSALNRIRASRVPVAVLYESPHRVVFLAGIIAGMWPQCRLCVCCDMTKYYEKIVRGTAPEVLAMLEGNENVEKGEYCLVLDMSLVPEPEEKKGDRSAEEYILSLMLDGTGRKEAARRASQAGYARNEIYRANIRIRDMLESEGSDADSM